MERTLKTLFDFQKYEGNPALQSVIDSVHSRYSSRELNLDEMEWVSAAGIPVLPDKDGKKNGNDPDGIR